MSTKKGFIPINFKNIIGNRYGRLMVIERAQKRHDKTYWKCLCDCGNTKEIYGGSLTNKKRPTQSCGCLNTEYQSSDRKKQLSSRPRLPNNESGLNDLFRQYKDNVKNRKLKPIQFLLSKEEFKILTKGSCEYCGIEPSGNRWGYMYNGIDRVDSEGDYIISNCVPCCFMCNLMKNRYSTEKFLNQITLIYNKHIKNKI